MVLTLPASLAAQQAEPTKAEAEARATALAKAAQNPVANMNTIPVQFNWTTGAGLGDQTQSVINVQPVLPLPINDDWNLISRTIVPFVSLPTGGPDRISGIADIQEQIYLTPAKSRGVAWGFGPIISLPTATNAAVSTGQFALGPTFVALKIGKKWVYGALVNQLWRVAGGDPDQAINSFFVQPFINYNLKRGWAISTAPAITANWDAGTGQVWTVPLGARGLEDHHDRQATDEYRDAVLCKRGSPGQRRLLAGPDAVHPDVSQRDVGEGPVNSITKAQRHESTKLKARLSCFRVFVALGVGSIRHQLLGLAQKVYHSDTPKGAIGFDGLEEGIAACPGPSPWLNRLETTKRQR